MILTNYFTYFNGSFGEVKSLLNDSRQFPNSSSLLPQHVLSTCGQDDNLRACGRHSDLYTTVAILGQLMGKEPVEFGLEHAVSYKLDGEYECPQDGVYKVKDYSSSYVYDSC